MNTDKLVSTLKPLPGIRRSLRPSCLALALTGFIAMASIPLFAENLALNGDFETSSDGAMIHTTGLIQDSTGTTATATFGGEPYLLHHVTHDTAHGSAGSLLVTIPATRHEKANSGNHGLFIQHENIKAGSRIRVRFDAKWISGPSKHLNVKRPWSSGHELSARKELTNHWKNYTSEFDYVADGVHVLFSFAPDGNGSWEEVSLGGAFLIDNIEITVIN